MSKRWLVHEPITTETREQFPELDPVVLQLLWNRGLTSQQDIDVFLGPDWSRDTFSPALFQHMSEAVEKTFHALEKGEVITVHGDYDADGVCGSTVLITTLRDLCRALGFDEKKITVYIPHREKEGYGVSVETIEHLHVHDKTSLVITVDCGISNQDAIERGKELGIDTIVCDHHTIPEQIPKSATLIHPLVEGETFPNKHLCGTGVAFKFASALLEEARKRGARFPDGYEKWLLDLVAIATVTDIVPLTGENRVLEKFGLLVLNKTRRVGLKKLVEVAGSQLGDLDTVSIGFQIGPRLNAAGRMNHATEALELLIEEDEERATVLATQLHETNIQRQQASQKMYLEAKQQIGELGDRKVLFAVGEGWSPGLVGLVAGKLQNEYHVPVFIVGKDGEKYVGSGRSVDGFDVTQALQIVSEYLDKFGGHPQACGFSTTGQGRFVQACSVMEQYAAETLSDELLVSKIDIDAEISLQEVTWSLYDAIERFRPFGCGNIIPVFLSRKVKVISFSAVGKDGAHLKLCVQSADGTIREAIAFRFGDWAQKLRLSDLIDVVYEVDVNEWNGNRELQLRVMDLQTS